MKIRSAIFFLILIVFFSGFAPAALEQPEAASRRGGDVQIYSLQILVNQAYQMVLEGANLVMLDQMGKGGVFGDVIDKRGWTMIDQGERIISEAVSGEEVNQMVREGKGSDSLLSAVKENAAQLLKAVAEIRTYLKTETAEPQLSQMHSLFTLFSHGMKMATDGANMIMLGRTGEPGGAKDTLQRHGRRMMKDGRVFIIRLLDNEAMQGLHSAGLTVDKSPAMASFHRSIELSLRIIDRMARI
jgi:hypothetical protein